MKKKAVSKTDWLKARSAFLKKEKAFTKKRDAHSAERRELPWLKVDKDYVFDGPKGKVSLSDLFAGRKQLITYHFMFGPDWKEGCPGCSFVADNFDGSIAHLAANEVSFVAISRAPLKKLEAFKKRMGWKFDWISSGEGDFNYDFFASFRDQEKKNGKIYKNFKWQEDDGTTDIPGASVFYKEKNGDIYYTYATFERGLDIVLATYHYFDMTPLGRNEKSPMEWMRHHDKY